jgi:hypothetical protein
VIPAQTTSADELDRPEPVGTLPINKKFNYIFLL